ncbi:MAG: DUF5916 domain-containing protein, partial [Thermoanaerobaculia bacterium]|nr:DUF5916 domain-containing protein [Thermoanaerobaculia bacterium]
NLEIIPTVTGRRTEARPAGPSGPFVTTEERAEAGVTVRWGVTPNVSLNAAVNPDFSQVEADAARLDVNTRFALFFPEQRPFFLEGRDFFETPLALVFTRTVADPLAGAKLTGKQGRHAFGAFVAQDRINNLVLPGSQGSSLTTIDEEVSSGVLRWRRDVGEASTFGLLYTGREGESGYRNHLAGIDGLYRFRDSDSLRFQLVGSTTRYPDELALRFGQPTGDFAGHTLLASYQHVDADWAWTADYAEVHPEFRADAGFIPRVGIQRGSAGIERRFRGGDDRWYSNLFLFLGVDGTREYDGAWNEWGADLVFFYQGPLQSFVRVGLAPNQEFFDGVTYHNFRQGLSGGFQPSGSLEAELGVSWGETIDFANRRAADFVETSLELEFFAGRRVEGELELDRQVFDVAGGELFTLDIAQTRLVYHFNLRTFLRTILQYRQIDRDPALYTFPVAADDEELLTQLLFSYKLNAQSVVLVGYSDNHAGRGPLDLTQTDRTVFFKIGYAWLR